VATGRTEIERTIRDEGSITRAAAALGASRRTLQNRMRAYGMPRGRAGRPRKRFRRRSSIARAVAVSTAIVGAVVLVNWSRKSA
jgi:hypothetical protein